jgi:xanthine dehydrogenase YagR molybdenum-binding subunit
VITGSHNDSISIPFGRQALGVQAHLDPLGFKDLPDLGLVRLSRFVGAYDAGRIINPKTARSQAIGGIIWGVGQALLEQSQTDPTMGRFLNRNYSGYLVPTNADIPEVSVLFMGDFDEEASPLGAKDLGELTAVSVAPAIANAVYHATGKRIRDLPITAEKLL